MKIKISTVIKLYMTDLDRLDPITVIAEDYGPGQGEITIKCYGKSWSAYWGGMGGNRNINEFFCTSGNDYIIGCLAPNVNGSIPDEGQGLIEAARTQLQTLLDDGHLEIEQHEDMLFRIDRELSDGLEYGKELMYDLFGSEWWHWVPEKTNPDYEYLWRIVDAIKVGLTEYDKVKEQEDIMPCPDCGQNTNQDENSYWCDDCEKLWPKEEG